MTKWQEICNTFTIKAPGRHSGSTNPLDSSLSGRAVGERRESDVRAMVVKSRRKKARIVPLFGDEDGEERADIGASSLNVRRKSAP